MMDAGGIGAKLNLDHPIAFSSTVVKAICDIQDGKGKSLQEALGLIKNTFYLVNSRRRKSEGAVIHFSVNIGDKGNIKLMRLRAVTTLNNEKKIIIAADLPEGTSGGSN